MSGPGDHQIIGVEPERQRIIRSHAIGGDEGRILDLDTELFEGRDQPVVPGIIAGQQA